ncbi:uncharacterized protein LOC143594742 [Bidens hawaiensis]|uniref:uncharacterized protein LOC143594742 n=1 Tax=Bidens hawaiensis TaxID=980011 RepID=UPI0040493D8B
MFSIDHEGCSNQIGLNFKIPDTFLPVSDESSNVNSFVDDINPNVHHFYSQENSLSSSDASFPFDHANIITPLSNNVCDQSILFCMMNEIDNSSPKSQFGSEESHYLTQDVAQENPLVPSRETTFKRKLETQELPDAEDNDVDNEKIDKNPKKRIRVSRDNKNKKNVQPKKNNNINDMEESNKKNNGEINGQSSSSCSSNDDGQNNSNGKTRASRGTATDPQSLYARKRRERINERLRILQNLVPNGTKVDISTMLEEAVEYVKFLKLQIQLLSCDDTWMYAPIAYNGMDMGLYQNITPNLRN